MKFFFTLLSRFLNYLVKPSEKASIVISSKQEIELEAETNLDNNIENVFSQFFTLEEVTRSETAIRNNIDNTPNHDQILQLQQLCSAILDRIREHYDKPIRILSGYRCEKLNKKIGGSKNSQHQALEISKNLKFTKISAKGYS